MINVYLNVQFGGLDCFLNEFLTIDSLNVLYSLLSFNIKITGLAQKQLGPSMQLSTDCNTAESSDMRGRRGHRVY